MKDILKGSFVIFIFKIFGAISLFLVHILISRYYGAQTLGVFNLILALMMIGAILSRVGLDMYIVRIIPSIETDNEKISLFLKEVFKIVFIGSILVSILFYLFSSTIDQYIFKSLDASHYLLGLIVVMIPFAFFNILPEVFRGFHEIKRYSFFRNLSQNITLLTLLFVSMFFNLSFDPIYILYSSIIVITFFLALSLFRFLKQHSIDLTLNGKYKDKIIAYSYPMFLTSSMMFLMGYVDSFMISYYLDEYQVGIYNACIKLSFAITFILASVNGFIAPKISQAYSKGDKDNVKQIYKNSVKLITLTSSPIFLLLYIFPEFFLGLFGDEFKVATFTLIIMNTAFLVNILFGSIGIVLNMTNNQSIVMQVIFVSVFLNFILNLLLIKKYGLDGAAIATLISTLLWNMLLFVIAKIRRIL